MAEGGTKVLLLGGSGSGKTYATATLAECGLNVRCLWMEPGCYHSFARYFEDKGKPIPDNVEWANAPLTSLTFAEMIDMAKILNTMTQKGIANYNDPRRQKHDAFIKVLSTLANFTSERTGKNFGPVDEWDTNTVLVFESLSTLSTAAMALLTGGRPLADQGEWQMAMNSLEQFLNKFTSLRCHAVLTSHLDRETDEQLGGTKLMAATLGRKLAPKVPRYFDDVILARREGTKFSWDTSSIDADLKTRLLPIAAGQPPSFAPLISRWRSLAGLAPTTAATPKVA